MKLQELFEAKKQLHSAKVVALLDALDEANAEYDIFTENDDEIAFKKLIFHAGISTDSLRRILTDESLATVHSIIDLSFYNCILDSTGPLRGIDIKYLTMIGSKKQKLDIFDLPEGLFKADIQSFNIGDVDFKSMPELYELTLIGNEITSLKGKFPKVTSLSINNNKIPSLENYHKMFPILEKIGLGMNPIKSNILSLVKMDKLHEFRIIVGTKSWISKELVNAIDIIKDGKADGDDILEIQQKLIDNNLEEFAKL